MEVNFNII